MLINAYSIETENYTSSKKTTAQIPRNFATRTKSFLVRSSLLYTSEKTVTTISITDKELKLSRMSSRLFLVHKNFPSLHINVRKVKATL